MEEAAAVTQTPEELERLEAETAVKALRGEQSVETQTQIAEVVAAAVLDRKMVVLEAQAWSSLKSRHP